jgi:hypothetical protein
MKSRLWLRFALVCGWTAFATLRAQTTPVPGAGPAPAPAPAGMAPPPGVTPARITDTHPVTTLTLPADNPFGTNVEAPAAPPPKPVFNEFVVSVPIFAAIRVDRTGKVTQSRRIRDPIPSLAADTKKSFDRWVFDPARRAGQPVETWSAMRVDLAVAVRAPKIEQIALTPVTPSTPIPPPMEWGTDAAWYESLKPAPITDGSVPVEALDTLANPKKTPWYADSFKGPFSCRLWVKVSAAGRIEKVVPIQITDPVLIAYFRHELPTLPMRPARAKGQTADSWNELSMSGTASYSIEVKQILNLRKSLGGSS